MSDENKPVDAGVNTGAGDAPAENQAAPQDTAAVVPEGAGAPVVESLGTADESKVNEQASASEAASVAAAETGATTAAPEVAAPVVTTPSTPPVAPAKTKPVFAAPAKKPEQATPQQQSLKTGAASTVTQVASAETGPTDGPTGVPAADRHLIKVDTRRRIPVLQIANYIKAMMPPKPLTETDIIRNQKMLYLSLRNIINNEVESFQHMWLAVLALFEHHKNDVFHPMYVNRGVANMELTKDETESFLRLVRLCSLTSNPQTRKQALAQFDLQAALSFELKESGRQRVTEFYSKFR